MILDKPLISNFKVQFINFECKKKFNSSIAQAVLQKKKRWNVAVTWGECALSPSTVHVVEHFTSALGLFWKAGGFRSWLLAGNLLMDHRRCEGQLNKRRAQKWRHTLLLLDCALCSQTPICTLLLSASGTAASCSHQRDLTPDFTRKDTNRNHVSITRVSNIN